MVGTCNGLLCLTEVHPRNGRVLVVVTNPVTGDKAKLPPLPPPSAGTDVSVCRDMFSFGCHPTTGRYKVVHVSCCPETDGSLLVFTLGHDRSWRELPLPTPPEPHGYKRNGVVSVDGWTYWLAKGRRSVVALDDSVTSFDAPPIGLAEKKPVQVSPPDCQLTNVQARLGVVVSQRSVHLVTMGVYVLEEEGGSGEQPRWSLNYTVVEQIALHGAHWIVAPCFTHGEYVLSQPSNRRLLYRRKVRDLEDDRGGGGVKKTQLRPLERAELVTKETERYREAMEPFAYVETLEPVPAILGG
jgi:F-box interacting protein